MTILVAMLAMGGVVFAFITNASPYVTIAQARATGADQVLLAGDIVENSMRIDAPSRLMTFNLKDHKGESIDVVYHGAIPANVREAKQVVAIGGVKNGKFESKDLQFKCPSKYEGEKKS